MQMLGVDLATIQSIVGHADVDMTKHYLHVQEPVKLAEIVKFSCLFRGKSPGFGRIGPHRTVVIPVRFRYGE